MDHWNDNAASKVFGVWTPLVYPEGHPWEGETIDMAFELTTVPEPGAVGAWLIAAVGVGLLRRRKQ